MKPVEETNPQPNTADMSPTPIREEMVGWFDPRQLYRAAQQVVVSSIIGRHADRRLIEALSTQALYFDFTAKGTENLSNEEEKEKVKENEGLKQDKISVEGAAHEFWIDYVSDVGDGWNATYAVAHQLVQPKLVVQDEKNTSYTLKRGSVLIFGGDEVYPTADRDQYKNRWESPYSEAFAVRPAVWPYAFAIPGNHDWYDSLASFSEKFSGSYVKTFPKDAGKKQNQGGWMTPQNRSYFALKLPHQWWLLGVDLQLNHDIDEAQLEYFEMVLEQIEKGEKEGGELAHVILCSPEPFWVYKEVFKDVEADYGKSRLCEMVQHVIQEKRIAVYLAGDLHHYYRVSEKAQANGKVFITAGGGGAFMHPTHSKEGNAFPSDERYEVKAYPDHATSRRLALNNLFFLKKNPWFGLVTGVLALLTAWFMLAALGFGKREILVRYQARLAWESFPLASQLTWEAMETLWSGTLLDSPFLGFLCLIVVYSFYKFTDVHASKFFRVVVGIVHGISHLLSGGLITWLGCLAFAWVELSFGQSVGTLLLAWSVAAVFVFLAGAIIGSSIFGIYLWISLNFFGYHTGEGSSLKIEGYKNFLRLKLAADGSLTIYPIGLDRVPCWSKDQWEEVRESNSNQPSRYKPRQGLTKEMLKEITPRLIDSPIEIRFGKTD